MAEYTCCYDRDIEPLIQIHTYSNEEQNWKGEQNWSIQIHYTNLYITDKQNITAVVQCAGIILDYETFKHKGLPNLYKHYKRFKFYSEPKLF